MDSGCMVHGCYFFINNDFFLSRKTENRTKKSLPQLTYLFEKKALFLPKNDCFSQKWMLISAILGILALKGIFSEPSLCLYLRAKFQVSGIILTNP